MKKTLEKITELLERQGIPIRQQRRKLESITGVSYSAVAQWFNSETKEIDYKNLKAIADYFNVSIDYLLDKEEISIADQELMSIWNSLHDHQKDAALDVLKALKRMSQGK